MIKRITPGSLIYLFICLLVMTGCGEKQGAGASKEPVPDPEFNLVFKTCEDKTAYIEGEQVSFEVKANRDCYVIVLLDGTDNEQVLLLPNAWNPTGKIEKDKRCLIPSRELGFRFPILPPHGKMKLTAIASKKQLSLRNVDSVRLGDEGFVLLREPNSMMSAGSKSINDGLFVKPLNKLLAKNSWTKSELIIDTKPMPVYDSAGSEKIFQTWRNLNKTIGTKSLLSLKSRRPFVSKRDQEAEGVIVYYKDSQDGTKSLDMKGEAASPAQKKGSPLGNVRLVTSGPEGSKSLGPADIEKQLADLKKNPSVETVIPNYVRHIFTLPKTRYAPAQWALGNNVVPQYDTGWSKVQEKVMKIKPVLIGVIDQGLVTSDDRLKALCGTIKGEIPDNNKDDDGNGWIDDVHGFNFVTTDSKLYFPDMDFSHGSFVSSIIGGRVTGAKNDVVGIAPNAEIISAVSLGPDGYGPDMLILAGLYYLSEQGVKVINMSLGGEVPPSVFTEYSHVHQLVWKHLEKKGIIVVCAAGNSNANNDLRPVVPGNMSLRYPNVITVSAVDVDGVLGRYKEEDGTWIQYSNYGEKSVTLAAPGSMILGIEYKNKQNIGDGTSYAAPIVSATVAMVWGQHPDWDYKTVIKAVTETVTPSKYLKDKCVTEGILNIEAALNWTP